MLALIAIAVLAPLLYIPGFLIERAIRGVSRTSDPLERHFERSILGALLNGWLALTLAEIGIFAAWLHLLLLTIASGVALWLAYRRGAIVLTPAPPALPQANAPHHIGYPTAFRYSNTGKPPPW